MTSNDTPARERLRTELQGVLSEGSARAERSSAGVASTVVDWLLAEDPSAPLFGGVGGRAECEPMLSLLDAYQRLNRAVSEAMHENYLFGRRPFTRNLFTDLAVSSLLRETYLDIRAAVNLLVLGMDVQAAVIIRHLWELALRTLAVAGDPEVGDEWERAIWGELSGSAKEAARLRDSIWAETLRPAELMRRVARLEVQADGLDGDDADETAAERIAAMKRVYFGFLSDIAHGGTYMLAKSAARIDAASASDDPFGELGAPTDWCDDLLRHILYLQAWTWGYVPQIGFASAPDDKTRLGVVALDEVVRSRYADQLWSADDWESED